MPEGEVKTQNSKLKTARVARFATTGASGKPHIVPVCFAFDGDDFYMALDEKPKSVAPTHLKRVRNILANPQVALLVDTYGEDWERLSYVLVSGSATLEPVSTERHRAAIQLLREKYPQYRAMAIDQQPVIMLTPTSVHGWSSAQSGVENEYSTRLDLDFATLARERHVVRQFKPIEVPRALVEQTLEAARWAPSPHGAQPWRFVVLTRPEPKQKLADAMAAEWRRNLDMDGQEPEVVETRLRKSQERILNSPVLIIPCLYLEDLDRYPDAARQEAEHTMAVQSLGAAIQNILLSAYSLGLDTGWMCAPLFCPEVVCGALDLPATLVPHALINLGYGAKDPPRRPHKPVSELIFSYE
jgi:PPOX class probable F420-dependent enzyme